MTVRNNLSWSEATEQKAQEIIAARKLDGMTDLVKTLVREEWDRRKDEINSPLAVEAAKIVEGAGHVPSTISPGGGSTKPRKGLPLRGTSKRTSRGSTQQDKGQQ